MRQLAFLKFLVYLAFDFIIMSIKRLIAFTLLLAFLAGTFSRLFVVADYYAFTSKYAKKCVNKARPAMHCNGKCQMMKKLKAEEKQESGSSEKKSETSHFNLICQVLQLKINAPANFDLSLKDIPFNKGTYSLDAEHGIFHPPRA